MISTPWTPTTFNLVSEVSNGLSCPETVTRTYAVTDNCGNTITVTQIITVDDNIAPVGNAPAPLVVECISDVPAADIALVTGVSDNCTAAPVVAFVSDASDGNTCAEVITRTYSITDECGNVTLVTQTITIDDTTDPTASNPNDLTVPGGPVPAPDVTVVTDEADNCTVNPVVEWVSDVSDNGACPETITRTYSVTDDCGNQITVTQLILITDPFPPTASNPAPIAVQCIGDVPAPDVTVVTVQRIHGLHSLLWEDDTSDGNSCPEVITRRYRVTDDCGNFIFVEQIITVNDDIAPVGTAPADVAVQCPTDVPADDITSLTGVSDNCTVAPVVTFVGDVSDGNSCPEVITRTYRITDDCGNFTDVTQTITIDDDIAPVGNAPAPLVVECIGDVPAADIALVTGVSDNCTATPVVAFVSDASDGNTCAEVITRTYSITDECGNVTLVTQTITIDDTTDPTASNPNDLTVPGGPVPAPDVTVVTDEADNCTVNPVVEWVSDVSDNGACPETITRTYSVTDDCGNQITVTQLILITDPFPPTASNPAPIAVQCIGDVPAPDVTVVTDEADNGATPVVIWEDDTSDGNSCPEVITRRYRVTDDCGNFIFVEQIITVNDDSAPVGTAPADVTVACASDVPAPDINSLIGVSDNCSIPTVDFVGDVSDNNVCNGEVIIRTYSITDECNNSITVSQTITISAVTPSITLSPSDPSSCGANDGQIIIGGLEPNSAFNFSYNGNPSIIINSDATGNYTLSGLSAGNYTNFTLSPADCPICELIDNTVINLVDPNAPFVDAGNNQTLCEGDETALTADNPQGAIISWDNGVTDGVNFTPLVGNTTYTVTANLDNCISTDIVSITVNPLPQVDAGPPLSICEGESAMLNGSGANSYTWDNGVTNGVSFIPDQTTTYTVTGNSSGCTATDQVQVTINPLSEVSFTGDNLTGCIPLTTVLTNNSSITGNSCVWDISNGQTLFGCNSVSLLMTDPGCYDVTLTVTTSAGCESQATVLNYICTEGPPNANFSADPMVVTSNDPIVNFTNGSFGAVNYEWDFGDGNTSNEINPSNQYESTEEGSYTVQLIALSQYGCSDTAYAIIEVQEDLIFYVPNTFTPDNDNYNETFQPVFTSGFDPYDFNLLIFNRWGEILFESNNANVGWDGTYGGKIVKDGTYIWKIEFKTKYTDERQIHRGHVNILR